MFKTFTVRFDGLRPALNVAADLMIQAGYVPNTREKGIVQWKDERDLTHHCKIRFRSYRGLNWSGYISVEACDCEEKWAFKEIVSAFERKLSLYGWVEIISCAVRM